MRRSIHQVVISASEGDAITGMALSLRSQLRVSVDSEIFSFWRHGDLMNRECLSIEDLPSEDEVSLLVYHASIGHKVVSQIIRSWKSPLALAYHNMTPSGFFRDLSDELSDDLDLGRQDLEVLKGQTYVALADSEFNAHDLRALGYSNVRVVPAGFDVNRLLNREVKYSILADMRQRFPNGYVVVVGQLLPHKRIEQAIAAVHILNSTNWMGIGLVICGSARLAVYEAAVHEFSRSCPMVDVHFAGHVTDEELLSYLVGASALLTMSDHEGMCIPPLEAARLGVPVVAKGSGALPETLQSAAFLLPATAGPVFAAEALHEVLTNSHLRGELINAGYQRAVEVQRRTDSSSASRILFEACP